MDDTPAAVTVISPIPTIPERKSDRRATLSAQIEALAEQLRSIGRAVETLAREIKTLKDSI